jgi:signal transduction histidine kinase
VVLNTIQANMRTEALLKQSQTLAEVLRSTNEELQEKAQLLSEQKDEVERTNVEIELAKRALEEKAEQLALTSKYKSEFLANMSHELRTPLNSLLLLAQSLAENTDGNLSSRQVEYARTIHASGADLMELINDILDLSKIESGTMAINTAQVRFAELKQFAERTFRQVAAGRRLDFVIETAGDVPEGLETDGKRLQQVLRNLLSNAFKFTEAGRVTLRMAAAHGGFDPHHPVLSESRSIIAFAVIDTGIGIPREKHEIIFEAFQQADGTTSRKYGGTGLGLSISRDIARLARRRDSAGERAGPRQHLHPLPAGRVLGAHAAHCARDGEHVASRAPAAAFPAADAFGASAAARAHASGSPGGHARSPGDRAHRRRGAQRRAGLHLHRRQGGGAVFRAARVAQVARDRRAGLRRQGVPAGDGRRRGESGKRAEPARLRGRPGRARAGRLGCLLERITHRPDAMHVPVITLGSAQDRPAPATVARTRIGRCRARRRRVLAHEALEQLDQPSERSLLLVEPDASARAAVRSPRRRRRQAVREPRRQRSGRRHRRAELPRDGGAHRGAVRAEPGPAAPRARRARPRAVAGHRLGAARSSATETAPLLALTEGQALKLVRTPERLLEEVCLYLRRPATSAQRRAAAEPRPGARAATRG